MLLLPFSGWRFRYPAFLLRMLGRFCPAVRPGLSRLREALRIAGNASSQSRTSVQFLQTYAADIRPGAVNWAVRGTAARGDPPIQVPALQVAGKAAG